MDAIKITYDHSAKAKLIQHILSVLKEQNLNDSQAKELLAIDGVMFSALTDVVADFFEIDDLLRYVVRLGQDVTITVG